MTLILRSAVLLLLAACGADAPGGGGEGASAQVTGAAADTTLVRSEDPELREMARDLLPDLAARSGLELRAPVRIARRTRAELEDYLETKLDRDLPPERAERLTVAYTLLGLLPPGFDLREILLELYTEQVAGFYDPDSTALFVMADQPAGSLETLLIHELVHAVQDQAADLDSLTAPARGNDSQLAAQAAIEGHATLVMLEFLTERATGEPVDVSEIPDFGGQVRLALAGLQSQYPALSGAPRIVQEGLLFPYLEGAGFVQALWRERDGRPAPFGDLLPRSTEQVLTAGGNGALLEDAPTSVSATVPGGTAPAYENGMGEMELRVFLEELTGAAPEEPSLGWDGDRYALFMEGTGASSLAWLTVWDSARERDAFVSRVAPLLPDLPRGGAVEGVEVEGRPAALLRVGSPPEVRWTLGPGG